MFMRFPRTFIGLCDRLSAVLQASHFRKGFMAKQTKITIETDSLLILRGRSSRRAWCPQCDADAEMITLENVGVVSNLNRPDLEAWLNSGELHRSQAADGSVLVCLNSLLARLQSM